MKKVKLILIFSIVTIGFAKAQEPTNVKLEQLSNKGIWQSEFVIQNQSYELQLINGDDLSTVELSSNSAQSRFFVPWYFIELVMPKQVELGDIDGNGLMDVTIVVANNGSGIAASLQFYIFLLQTSEHQFCYLGCLTDGDLTFEDLNNDGFTEVISRTPDYFGEERTVTYNAFNIEGCSFINVDSKFNYPKMNFRYSGDEVTLSDEQLKQKSKSTPDLMAN